MIRLHVTKTVVVLGLSCMAASIASAQTAPTGEQLFKQRCQACHTIAPGAKGMMGPNLAGIVGAKAGSSAYAYSPALKGSGITWDKQKLDQYLAGPSKMIPGVRMPMSVPDAAQRQAIIAFLAAHS
ncbi:c-type cytochrome [Sphingomonas sp. BIUV-7]|uniref:C-type cytochrome n=1 Tax=Sphingomonas natans TaxID=3063330 RepID=A0ABT8Y6V8_9SPHN|nr:c-type cytochrome [Sphingomonas sp. BIUV-7]MDO6414050.1 c-type cytochrome [Sphingomonas sp. BIUV-7]